MKAKMAEANPGFLVQAVKEASARNEYLVELLAAQTLYAEGSHMLLAKKPEIDLLLRLAGTSQISRAIRNLGAKAGSPFLLVVAGRAPVRAIPAVEGKELPRAPLTRRELSRIEKAALLDAARA